MIDLESEAENLNVIKHTDLKKLPKVPAAISFVTVSKAIRRMDSLIDLLTQIASIKSEKDENILYLDNSDISIYEKMTNYADKVIQSPGKGTFEAYTGDFFYDCKKDWIFIVSDDELLSTSCTRELLQHYISNRNISSYWIPRRWYINSKVYICNKPWYPDYQLRLYRNLPSIVTLPKNVHYPVTVAGNSEKIDLFCIKHLDLFLNTREDREKKVKFYESLNPVYTGDDYYFYEDYKCVTAVDGDFVKCNISDSISADIPKYMQSGVTYGVEVLLRVENSSASQIIIYNENVFASSHWYNEDMSIYHWDYDRSTLNFTPVDNEFTSIVSVDVPKTPGNYHLQLDIVEEGVQWFCNTGLLSFEPVLVRVI